MANPPRRKLQLLPEYRGQGMNGAPSNIAEFFSMFPKRKAADEQKGESKRHQSQAPSETATPVASVQVPTPKEQVDPRPTGPDTASIRETASPAMSSAATSAASPVEMPIRALETPQPSNGNPERSVVKTIGRDSPLENMEDENTQSRASANTAAAPSTSSIPREQTQAPLGQDSSKSAEGESWEELLFIQDDDDEYSLSTTQFFASEALATITPAVSKTASGTPLSGSSRENPMPVDEFEKPVNERRKNFNETVMRRHEFQEQFVPGGNDEPLPAGFGPQMVDVIDMYLGVAVAKAAPHENFGDPLDVDLRLGDFNSRSMHPMFLEQWYKMLPHCQSSPIGSSWEDAEIMANTISLDSKFWQPEVSVCDPVAFLQWLPSEWTDEEVCQKLDEAIADVQQNGWNDKARYVRAIPDATEQTAMFVLPLLRNNHWSCAAVLAKDKRITTYDSSPTPSTVQVTNIVAKWFDLICLKTGHRLLYGVGGYTTGLCIQQVNASDCGPHTFDCVTSLARGRLPFADQGKALQQANAVRKEQLHALHGHLLSQYRPAHLQTVGGVNGTAAPGAQQTPGGKANSAPSGSKRQLIVLKKLSAEERQWQRLLDAKSPSPIESQVLDLITRHFDAASAGIAKQQRFAVSGLEERIDLAPASILSLLPNTWLSGEAIEGILATYDVYLQDRSGEVTLGRMGVVDHWFKSTLSGLDLFDATAVTPFNLTELKSKAVAIFNITNLHYLTACFDKDERKIQVFDSYQFEKREQARHEASFGAQILSLANRMCIDRLAHESWHGAWQVEWKDTLQQCNSDDCGVHSIVNLLEFNDCGKVRDSSRLPLDIVAIRSSLLVRLDKLLSVDAQVDQSIAFPERAKSNRPVKKPARMVTGGRNAFDGNSWIFEYRAEIVPLICEALTENSYLSLDEIVEHLEAELPKDWRGNNANIDLTRKTEELLQHHKLIFRRFWKKGRQVWQMLSGPGRSIDRATSARRLAWNFSDFGEAALAELAVTEFDFAISTVRTSRGSTKKLSPRQLDDTRCEALPLLRAYMECFMDDAAMPPQWADDSPVDPSLGPSWYKSYRESVSSHEAFGMHAQDDEMATLLDEQNALAAESDAGPRRVLVVGCGWDGITTDIDAFAAMETRCPDLDITFALALRPGTMYDGLFATGVSENYSWGLYSLARLVALSSGRYLMDMARPASPHVDSGSGSERASSVEECLYLHHAQFLHTCQLLAVHKSMGRVRLEDRPNRTHAIAAALTRMNRNSR